MRRLVVAALVTFSLAIGDSGVGLPPLVLGFEGPPGDPNEDVATYMALSGEDRASAIQQLAELEGLVNLESTLTSNFPDSFAGIWIEHSPYAIKVAAKDHSRDLSSAIASTKFSRPVQLIEVKRSLAELVAAASALRALSEDVSTNVDVYTNTVEVKSQDAAAFRALIPVADVGRDWVKIYEVESIGGPTVNLYGGLGGSEHGWSGCPSGFTVRQAGSATDGFITAGHCGNTLSYLGTNLPYVIEWLQTDSDSQWHRAPGFTVQPAFIYTQSQLWRYVDAVKSRTGTLLGQSVCKYGPASFQTCGWVESKTIAPFWVPNASNTFIRAKKSNCEVHMVSDNDSGGPVFWGGGAYGIVSGKELDIFCSNQRMLIYTGSLEATYHFNVSIKVH